MDHIEQHRKPVIVLGASGYVGRRVMEALNGSGRWRAIPVSRRPAKAGWVTADAVDVIAMRALLSKEGAHVVNCVAGRSMMQATDTLCRAAREVGGGRIVHLSSMAVYGTATGLVTESQEPVAPLSGYGQTKLECERRLRRHMDGGGSVVILRPSCVFGPGSPQWTTRIARLLRARRLGDLGAAGDGGCNLIFVDDLAATVVNALDTPEGCGQAFNVSSPDVPTWNEFLVRFGMALNAVPVRRIPARMLKLETKLLAPARRVLAKGTDHPLTEAITPSLLALFGQGIRLDSTRAIRTLDMPARSVSRMIDAVSRPEMALA
ncbi:MAG TPA: NAD(P)-dependent oxidoreductase [Rhodopila sp.]|uniref:NAD-dependent epimerase/dehydratase family protein n=1 Tax=Rhodopila sp. TaxID=2480087 RepID=UPI002CC323F0|nr:NAD(P)-dependent oxidoreductase [Rhodopila sp.]HVY14995.1 NAD(P)-dependent oxidoreductase [Rhodopila sp.]